MHCVILMLMLMLIPSNAIESKNSKLNTEVTSDAQMFDMREFNAMRKAE